VNQKAIRRRIGRPIEGFGNVRVLISNSNAIRQIPWWCKTKEKKEKQNRIRKNRHGNRHQMIMESRFFLFLLLLVASGVLLPEQLLDQNERVNGGSG
jgi:hypothetical protein